MYVTCWVCGNCFDSYLLKAIDNEMSRHYSDLGDGDDEQDDWCCYEDDTAQVGNIVYEYQQMQMQEDVRDAEDVVYHFSELSGCEPHMDGSDNDEVCTYEDNSYQICNDVYECQQLQPSHAQSDVETTRESVEENIIVLEKHIFDTEEDTCPKTKCCV